MSAEEKSGTNDKFELYAEYAECMSCKLIMGLDRYIF